MNRQTQLRRLVWQNKRNRLHRKQQATLIVFAIPVLAIILVWWAVLSGSVKADESTVKPDIILPRNQYVKPVSEDSFKDDWQLLLVNPWNILPEDYEVTLKQLKNNHSIDERCYPDLQKMMDDCRAEELEPYICSSYRTMEKQKKLFDNRMKNLVMQGYSPETAYKKTTDVIAVPGTSEHQTGLAVDIVDTYNQNLDETQESTPVQKWLMENSWKYGFILRYPPDKSDITGIVYEPWHYRYVGREAAKEIYEKGICLEEYLNGGI